MTTQKRWCGVCLAFHDRPAFQAYEPKGRDFTTEDKLWMALLLIFVVTLGVALTLRGAWS